MIDFNQLIRLLLVAVASLNLVSIASDSAAVIGATGVGAGGGGGAGVLFESSRLQPLKVKRDSSVEVVASKELDTQESGYLPASYLPPTYSSIHAHPHQPTADDYQQHTDSDYSYDAGKNAYGKQAGDWSIYDQGNHGLLDKYGDKAWNDHNHAAHSAQGKHDSYGSSYNSHGGGQGSGYYSRDRGYGYEKHYAYDKEVASKHHSDNHNSYGNQHGLHDHYGNSNLQSDAHHGHDKYGQLSRYGNHGYGSVRRGVNRDHDYNHQNKAHYFSHHSPPSSYSSGAWSAPADRSTYYSDRGYFPSYY